MLCFKLMGLRRMKAWQDLTCAVAKQRRGRGKAKRTHEDVAILKVQLCERAHKDNMGKTRTWAKGQ
jgi:hypothetical protein